MDKGQTERGEGAVHFEHPHSIEGFLVQVLVLILSASVGRNRVMAQVPESLTTRETQTEL